MTSASDSEFFSKACKVQLFGPRGACIVAKEFIKAGSLLARLPAPIVWTCRASPECSANKNGKSGGLKLNSCISGPDEDGLSVSACENCFQPFNHITRKYQNGAAKRCSGCHSVFYCSNACQSKHWTYHKHECKLFSAVYRHTSGCFPGPTCRLFLRILLNRVDMTYFSPRNEGTSYGEGIMSEDGWENLQSDENMLAASIDEWCHCFNANDVYEKIKKSNNSLTEFATSIWQILYALDEDRCEAVKEIIKGLKLQDVKKVIQKVSANVYSIVVNEGTFVKHHQGIFNSSDACECCRGGTEVAIGLYGDPISKFNHSCVPNAFVSFGGESHVKVMSVLAERSIAAGEEIFVSYVLKDLPRVKRRLELFKGYNFICKCPLCCCCNPPLNQNLPHSQDAGQKAICPGRWSTAHQSRLNNLRTCLAEAFDIQQKCLFCINPSCRKMLKKGDGDALSCIFTMQEKKLAEFLEMNNGNETVNHNLETQVLEMNALRTTMHLPLLVLTFDDREVTTCDRKLLGSFFGKCALKLHICNGRVQVLKIALPRDRDSNDKFNINKQVLILPKENAHGSSEGKLQCCFCGKKYSFSLIEQLINRLQRVHDLTVEYKKFVSSADSSQTPSQKHFEIGIELSKEHEFVRGYLHPANKTLSVLRTHIISPLLNFPALYFPLLPVLLLHEEERSAALFGANHVLRANQLSLIAKVLLFLAQEGSDFEVRILMNLCMLIKGDPNKSHADLELENTAVGGVCPRVQGQKKELRAMLAWLSRDYSLEACGVFFSLNACFEMKNMACKTESILANTDGYLRDIGEYES